MNTLKKVTCVFLAFVLFVSTVIIHPTQMQAAEKPSFTLKTYDFTYIKGQEQAGAIFIENMSKNAKITKVSSSNKKVVSVSLSKNSASNNAVQYKTKGVGKTTITAKVKVGKKTYTVKCKINVKNYTNPISSLKIGNKDYKNSVKKSNDIVVKYKKNGKYKISVKCKKNWVLQHIGYFEGNGYTTIQNKTTIKVKKNFSYLVLSFYNTKTKTSESVRVTFSNTK